jgi:predicted outer membrane repeat protein
MCNVLNRLVSTIAILGVLLAGMPVREAHAGSTITVNSATEPVGLLSVVPDGLCTLREAISSANADNSVTGDCVDGSGADTITFAANYTITLNLTPGQLVITSPITITGNGSANTILQAHSSPNTATWRVFEVQQGGSLTLQNLTVRHGGCHGACPTEPHAGGAIYNAGTLTISNSVLTANTAGRGGAIENTNTLAVTNSTLSDNDATGSGGAINSYTGVMTVTGSTFSGNDSSWGGAINSASDAAWTVTNTELSGNTALTDGGAINNGHAALSITDSLLSGNSAGELGGGVSAHISAFTSPGPLTMINTTFSGGSALHGGGVYTEGTLNITGGTFSGNAATGTGGAIHIWGPINVAATTFAGNQADKGGAIYNKAGIGVANSTFYNNSAATIGGAIHNYYGTLTLRNSTLAGNSAPTGGGIGNEATLNYTNTIIADSTAGGDCANTGAGAVGTNLNNLVEDGSCAASLTGDPMLGALADNGGNTQTMALQAGSSAINAGDDVTCTSSPVSGADQRGVARPQGPFCDIGAYEARYYSISGNAGAAGAELSYTQNGPKTTITDANGSYAFTVLEHWSGTVTPSKEGCAFTPTNRAYSDVTTSWAGENYAATCTAPTFLTRGNAGVPDAVLSYDDGAPQSVTADPDGAYGFTVPSGWSGTVTPAKDDFLFNPASRSYADVNADQLNQDYAAEKQTPIIARLYPEADTTACRKPNVGVELILAALVRTPAGAFDASKVTLKLDGGNVTSQAQIRVNLTSPANRATILYTPPVDLVLGTHQAQFIYPGVSGLQTATWNFTAANMACGTTLTMSPAEPAASDETQQQASAERIQTSEQERDPSVGPKSIEVEPLGAEPAGTNLQAAVEPSVAATQEIVAEGASPADLAAEPTTFPDAAATQPVIREWRGSPTRVPHRRVAPWPH